VTCFFFFGGGGGGGDMVVLKGPYSWLLFKMCRSMLIEDHLFYVPCVFLVSLLEVGYS
jgi:hypothetical protein